MPPPAISPDAQFRDIAWPTARYASRRRWSSLATVAKARRRTVARFVFDGYRPQRAASRLVKWVADPSDEITKAEYYPAVDKGRLIAEGYIGAELSHSTGLAVDLSLQRADGSALDFGTSFDFFDPHSSTRHPAIKGEARMNRERLVASMAAENFENYPREWWHFHLRGVDDAPAFDLPIT